MGIRQFPYTLNVFQKAEDVYNEANGSWIPGIAEWVTVSKCRDEGNGGGNRIVTTDGEIYVFGAVIYLPKSSPKVALGARIKVTDKDGNVRLEGDNKLFKKEQLHARLWV
ncbi:hypothetical protein HHL23_09490 [Chryseobacterium sp. RP-3-3]|uniref:Uncharacterized protein n=1 Tax=Chryseobacterium antibioticum TaxID=2728847 RepID=A0A7Y0FRD7_9FLAO|nr:hypothetical protein [Chryseobacterium antibioticum]NML70033.1 hypothetical protein [Chryseobacterium antibioticum]